MKGGTRKRGSTWSYYFYMGTVAGKRRKKEKGGFLTKKEAEAAFMEREMKSLNKRFAVEKKRLHAQYVAERETQYGVAGGR